HNTQGTVLPRLTVKVLDSYYDYEVYGALVTVRAGNFKRSIRAYFVSPEGAVFENLEPGDYEIIVRNPYSPHVPYKGNVSLSDEDKVVEVKLLRPIEISVRDPDGNPINDASVRMVNIATYYDELYDSLLASKFDYEESVNQEGRIELLPLDAGTHVRIEVKAPGYKESSITIPFFVNKERLSFNVTLEPEQ
ncbi:MAG: carboxypeptidase-like regulatory domain-containing protein, partial [Acidilobaceae archaeon]|nr:carboxypeptidase-like regulatory domain-containing protein [Acidilobaceae archaeon]